MQRDKYLEEDLNYISDWLNEKKELAGKNILVTGATGLLGSLVIRSLLVYNKRYCAGVKVLGLIRSPEKAQRIFSEYEKDENLSFMEADITQPLDLKEPVDFIIHTASVTASKEMAEMPVETIRTAIYGTANMLDLAKKKDVRSMVQLSSMEAFGVTNEEEKRLKETDLGKIDLTNVRSCYPESKRMCELLGRCYWEEYQVPVKSARLAQTFGAGTPFDDNRVFAMIARSVIRKEDIILHSEGKSVGNYCYSMDTVEAIFTLLLSGTNGESYTVVNENAHSSIRDMAEMAAQQLAGGKIRVVIDIPQHSKKLGYAAEAHHLLSSEKLCALGWRPHFDLQQCYERMIGSMQAGIK